ncbi:acyltransferase [Rothia kristinae]|uniref:acyltransferase n=1 Tax=Rothia kristinae TaxID=37923 RepID=UPI0013F4D63A|nr:acyltransferase [Rothia kristinae]
MSSASPSDRPAHTGPAAGRLPAGPDATAASSPARRFHTSGLDALRAIAVLAVVIYHVGPGLLPGACSRRCWWSSPCAARRPCWAARICGCTWTGRSSVR